MSKVTAIVGVVVAGLVFVSACSSTPTSAGTSTGSVPKDATRINDVDGDGKPDLVLSGDAKPANEGQAEVVVMLATGVVQTVTAAELGLLPSGGQVPLLGDHLVVADLNRDGYADIITTGSSADGTQQKAWAIWGSAAGISATHITDLASMPQDVSAITVVALPEPVVAVSTYAHSGGAVRLYPVSADGQLKDFTELTLQSPGIAGPLKLDQDFGRSLASSGDLLVIGGAGGPGRRASAGVVHVLKLLGGGKYLALEVDQDSLKMPGGGQGDDGYGNSVSILGDQVVVGVPNKKVDGLQVAGAVDSFRVKVEADKLVAYDAQRFTQGSSGVPGKAAAKSSFGWHVQAIMPCDGVAGALVSAGADDGTRGESSYGSVTAIPLSQPSNCPAQVLAHKLEIGHQELSVQRTSPNPTTQEAPMVLLGDDITLAVGWPPSPQKPELAARAGLSSVNVVALPAS